jgi:hypothetical protein
VLVQRGGRRILDALLPALEDRSSQVKFVIVEAMRRRADLRDPRALGALKRITTNRSLKKHSPGLCEYAHEVIAMIEAERSGPRRRPR